MAWGSFSRKGVTAVDLRKLVKEKGKCVGWSFLMFWIGVAVILTLFAYLAGLAHQ